MTASSPNRPRPAAEPEPARIPPAAWIAAVAVPFAAYLFTMPPDIVFEDAGIFASACYTGGLAHPPGYPLHTLLCMPFARLDAVLPVSPAMGTAVLSALANALAAGVLLWLLHQFLNSLGVALALALAYAFGLHSWSQSIIPEVYTLNSLLFLTMFALTLRYRQTARTGFAYFAALTAGLGLANHWPLFLAAAPACLLLLLRTPPALGALLRPKTLSICLALFLLGLAPYARMLAVPESAYVFQPIGSLVDLAHYVSRDIYLDRIERLELADRFAHMLHGIPIAFEEHPLPVSLLALPGIWACWRRRDPALLAAMLWMLLSTLVLLKLLAGYFWLNDLERHTFSVYHHTAFAAMAYFIGEGLLELQARLRLPAGSAAVLAVAALLSTAAANYSANQRSGDTLALRYAELVWKTYPPDTRVELLGDLTFPVSYLRHVRPGLRPDVVETTLPDMLGDEGFAALILTAEEVDVLSRIAHPLVVHRPLAGPFSVRQLGVVSQLVPSPGETLFELDDENAAFMLDLARRHPHETDTWNRNYIEHTLEEFARLLKRVRHENPGSLPSGLEGLYIEVALTLPGQVGIFLAQVIDGFDALSAREILVRSSALRAAFPRMARNTQALMLQIEGTALARLGDLAGSERLLAESIRLSPSPKENTSIIDLMHLYALQEKWPDYRSLRLRYRTLPRTGALEETDRACRQALRAPCVPSALPGEDGRDAGSVHVEPAVD